MNIDIVTAIENNDTKMIEVVKEITNDEGDVAYELHLIPFRAINNIAASQGIENPDYAMDFVLYKPYVSDVDEGVTAIDRIKKCKERLTNKADRSKREENRKANLISAGVHERYHPLEGMDPIEVIRARGKVTTENILLAKDRLNQKENHRDTQPREQRTSEDRRSEPRRSGRC